jgi:hypothetical protein
MDTSLDSKGEGFVAGDLAGDELRRFVYSLRPSAARMLRRSGLGNGSTFHSVAESGRPETPAHYFGSSSALTTAREWSLPSTRHFRWRRPALLFRVFRSCPTQSETRRHDELLPEGASNRAIALVTGPRCP